MKRKPLNVWMAAGLFAVLYALVFKTILTAWINPKGNAFTFLEYSILIGEVLFSLGSLYIALLIINKFLPKLLLGFRYGIILLLSSVIFLTIFLPYWVLFVRSFIHGLPTDRSAYALEAWSRILTLHLPISIISIISLYNHQAHKKELQLLGVQKALAETQLKNLQQQVDPHFLFNSLNILSALIKLDAERAVLFTQKLSEVYRFFLKTQKETVISLKEEIELVNDYFFLITCRFGKAFQLKVNQHINIIHENFYIIPGTLQLLVENVIKHNIADEKSPTIVEIKMEENKLIISNPISLKDNVSSGYGLNNLISRYQLLNGGKVDTFIKSGYFYVQVPLIKKMQ
ncbi:MAG: histidine kinase [Chitinophagaceae bacterium]